MGQIPRSTERISSLTKQLSFRTGGERQSRKIWFTWK